jgi:general secretion pathway protein B
MSYILDALRRADAERERGGVPGLHTQAMPEPGDDDAPARRRGLAPWQWLALGLAGGVAVAAVWMWRGEEPPPAAPAPPPPPPQATLPAPPQPMAPAEPPPTATPAAPVAIAPMRATPAPTAAAPASAPVPVAAPATAPRRVNSLAELPPDARAGLPPLAFGGSIYSNTPANRLLIVNGQLMHEGDTLGAGVTLEQIRPKAAVLNIRGQRFEVGL